MIHGLAGLVCFSLVAMAAFALAWCLRREPDWRRWSLVVAVCGALVIAFFIASIVASVIDATGALPNAPTGLLVAARTVAEALADLATSPDWISDGPIPEIAGPREESLVEMATLVTARRGDPVRIEGTIDQSDPDHAVYTSGALLPSPHAMLAGPTFEEWLSSRTGVALA